MAARILVADDEHIVRRAVRERLVADGHEVLEAADGESAKAVLWEQDVDLALLDMRLGDTDGMKLLERIREVMPDLPVIIMTGYSSVGGAVEAMKAGAFDYLTKPFDMNTLASTVAQALEKAGVHPQLTEESRRQKGRFGLANIVGESPGMLKIKELVRRIADSETSTVLLLGESGVGKDMIARAIHYESDRVDKPFVNITCTALPDTLLESELFGYEKGAFTDAKVQKKGLLELAQGGTAFLNEVGDMSPSLQSKLLYFLENKTFKRIGGTADVRADVRIVAATNRNLEQAIEQQKFREDLYYRLSIVPILLPPLRERGADVVLLANQFLGMFNRELRRHFKCFSEAALERLRTYHWPGNVRELRNVVERAVLLGSGDVIEAEHVVLGRTVLGAAAPARPYTISLPDGGCRLADVERELILQALNRTSWNQTHAARLLGITRDQIRYKVEKFGLRRSREEEAVP